MNRIDEIQARLAEINTAIDTATGDELTALETEARGLLDELHQLQAEAEQRQALRASVAAGAGTKVPTDSSKQISICGIQFVQFCLL